MPNRLCDTEIWTKDWFLNLNTKQKLLVKFLFDNCDCAGFYQISWNLLRVYFNDVEITKDDFKSIKQVKFVKDNLIFIEDFALYQCKVKSFKELNPKNKAHLGVIRLLEKYSPFEAPLKPLASPFEGAQEKDKEKEQDKDTTTTQQEFKNKNSSLKEKENLTKEKESSDLSNWLGEYSNVHLTDKQATKLAVYIGDIETTKELIEQLSENIAAKKANAPPYDEDYPDMHYVILKKYWDYRKQNPQKFKPQSQEITTADIVEKVRKRFEAYDTE